MRVLIVEDEKLLAESLKTLLERKGFTVETAFDGITGGGVCRDRHLRFVDFGRDDARHGWIRRGATGAAKALHRTNFDADGQIRPA
mgnify:CR=1 FL=1